ncbi:hypothetical protein S245_040965 [Arachis hypogaea]
MTYLTYSPKGLDGECFHEQMIFVEQGIELVLLQVAFLIYRPVMRLLKSQRSPDGSQAYILDDIIDHVKYLQLQLKELSGSRLQAESTAIPLVFHEGYGHYIDQQKLNEPLEEMMGKLLEENPASASQLLENNGLVLLPMELVQDLYQSMQIFGNSNALV